MITIGELCDFRSHTAYATLGVPQPCVFNTLCSGAEIRIGAKCAMTAVVICAKESVVIGERVMVGSGAMICDTDFHSLNHKERRTGNDIEYAASSPVEIGDDCFIGAKAIILKGVSIGARSVVAAGAVVAKSVPADVVVAGNPARVVKQLIEN